MNIEAIEKIFTINLAAKPEERILVMTDIPPSDAVDEEIKEGRDLKEIAEAAVEIGSRYAKTSYLEYPSQGSHGSEPPVEAWRAAFGESAIDDLSALGLMEKILNKEISDSDIEKIAGILKGYAKDGVDCVLSFAHYSTSHTRFRRWLTSVVGTRYASMPLFDKAMLDGAMNANWKGVWERTIHLGRNLRGTESANIKTPAGTDITFSIKGREVHTDTGIITKRGSFTNLPAGEAFVAPVEGTAEGKMVLEWAPTRKLESPVTLVVKEGMVTDIEGDEPYADTLREAMKENPLAANIAELGVGTNEEARRPDNILESEKILGTVHIAIGDNSTFGGSVSVPFHQDFIFFTPTLVVTKGGDWFLIIQDGFPIFC